MEAAYTVCNSIIESNLNTVKYFVNLRNGIAFQNLKNCLKIKNSRLVITILETFQYILSFDL